MLLLALHLAAHAAAPTPPPREPAIVRDTRLVGSSGLVALAALMKLPYDVATDLLAPLGPVPVAFGLRRYLAFEATQVVLMFDRETYDFAGVAPPDLLWSRLARPKLFAALEGRWRVAGVVFFHKSKTGGPRVTPHGYGMLVRGNLLCYLGEGETPIPEFSHFMTPQRWGWVDFLVCSSPCRDERDALAKNPHSLFPHRAVLVVGPVVLMACNHSGAALELGVWHRVGR